MSYIQAYQTYIERKKVFFDEKSGLEYSLFGNGEKVILALLGNNLLGSDAYFKTIEGLSEKYRVLTFLSRTKHQTVEQIADDISILLTSLNISKVNILGISIGGAVAQVFAKHYPNQTESIMLYQTFAHTNVMDDEALAVKEEILTVIAQLEELRKQVSLENIKMAQIYQIEEMLGDDLVDDTEDALDLFKYLMIDYTEDDEKRVMGLLKGFLENTIIKKEDLSFLTNKTLYIYDSEERAFGGLAMDDALLDIIPDAKAVSLDLDKFLIILEANELVRIIVEFMDQI
ncbi:MAG: alpha/beta hydrolase [Candidatus Phytoplasma sp.]|nr:alpha/beta hydrolase [Phytoplasma sp.]